MPPDNSEYVSQDDSSEAARLAMLNGGTGEVLLSDEEVKMYALQGYGFDASIHDDYNDDDRP